ncbi:MAG TPA: ABC transporter permease [Candidatus Pseudogracilibacillus intestinigallinarum]|uniref:ABC transporter permease n=1 Tax=Candidatus Pseudogracilibacillus intestinigallinarum TaxID=2838742 RepID=A0A9D1PK06_9BACI|nr:ABC transporter permease [Candidatus Pseudogracilibacillus intestinigallinarum]
MTFRKFAFNNVIRNKRLYAAYFISSMFTVMVFFTFLNFAFHPLFSESDINKAVFTGMSVAGGIIYVFSFFFILYSMSSFLQSRKREFGILMIQGMSTQQIRKMVFLENMLIGFLATMLGILFGVVFSKGILLIAENLLVMDEALNFYFPTKAIIVTFISFILLFLFISIFVTFILNTNKVITLIKGDKIGKSEPKANVFLTLIAVALLGAGYFIAVTVKGASVAVALLPVVTLVTIGTYLLFSQLNVYVIRMLKNRKGLFWKKTNMLLFSDLAFRMKDNARVFFMVTIISTVAFSAIGTLVGFSSLITDGMKDVNEFTYSYTQDEKDEEEIVTVNRILDDYGLDYEEREIAAYSAMIDDRYVTIVTPEMYNEFASLIDQEPVTLAKDEAIIVEPDSKREMIPMNMVPLPSAITLKDGSTVEAVKTEEKVNPNVLLTMGAFYVVGESIFEQLPEPENIEYMYAWEVTKGSEDDIINAGRDISQEILGFTAVDYVVYDINKVWSPVLFVGLFIGIVFFVSAGSFLYFRLYTDLDSDREKFAAISKIGLTEKEMNKVISKQIGLLFFIPMSVAVIHGAVALTALSHMFGHNLVRESVMVLGSFFIIQVLYFIVVRYFYTKQIRRAM